MKKIFYPVILSLLLFSTVRAQFGQNKVNYKEFDWFYIQTKHFDIYFSKGGEKIAEFTSSAAEDAIARYQKDLNYQLNNRISIIVYNSHNDFQESNITDEYLSKGTGGFTEPFKNRVVFPFEGSYKKFQHVIAHELVHAIMRDMYYGGTIQNIISKGITLQLPTWFWEGSAEFLSQGWETNTDMFIRNAIISENLPDINQLDGYLAYRGGQALFKYISDTYGRQKIGEIMAKVQGLGGLEPAMKAAIGINIEELNERWKKSLKKQFWPDIAVKQDPDELSKRLTDNKKEKGFYNTSPAISPQGDKIAYISDRDIYLDVYIMNAHDGKVIKKLIESGTTVDFEELTVLNPSLAWSPDNIHLALSGKSGGYDVITIIDSETEKTFELPFQLLGIESISWSRDGNKLAFSAQNSSQSDIYIYDMKTKQLSNLTNDIYSDSDPTWSPDGKKIIFSSDRGDELTQPEATVDYMMYKHNYKQLDLYSIDVETKKVERLTDWPFSDEKYPLVSTDGKELLFVSDHNGINNIYKKSLVVSDKNPGQTVLANKAIPITNSLSDLGQTSISYDSKKMVFSALYNTGYNVFMLNNPFEMKVEQDSLKYTNYMNEVINAKTKKEKSDEVKLVSILKDSTKNKNIVISDSTAQKTKIFVGQYVEKKAAKDTTAVDYSRYVFGKNNVESDSSQIAKRKELFKENLDGNGNFLVNKYKINFSPDIIYANAGYETLYGLLGTTVLSFSDVLGNHRLIGETSLQVDIKNSDYALAYYYLKERVSYGIEAFHTARFLYRDTDIGQDLYRFSNFGAILQASYPLDRFHRIDFGFSILGVTAEDLDDATVPADNSTFTLPSVSFTHDNVLWGYTSPIEGTRYSLTIFGDPGFVKQTQSFYSFVFDYRHYLRFWWDNGFVFRLSGGISGGGNAQRFFIGGTESWINREFATGAVPVSSAADYAFLTPALPLRGYDYAERLGTKYGLMNLELHVPIIRYLLTGGLPVLFQNVIGVFFLDAGTAWDDTKQLKLIGKNDDGDTVTQDLLMGTGAGIRVNFLFMWKFDVAWKFNLNHFSEPRYLVSLGLDL